MRLAVFVDQIFWRDGDVLSTDESYILFPASFLDADSVDEIVFIGREAPERKRAPYVLDRPGISLCPLPYYPSLYQLWRANPRIYAEIRQMIRRQAPSWDALMISGPNLIGQIVAREAAAVGVPIVPIVRQNLVRSVGAQRGLKGRLALLVAQLLEGDFRRLARGRVVFTVGMEMAEAYRRHTSRVHAHFPCLVDDAQFRMFSAMAPGSDPTRLLSVGRLSAEKGLPYLLEALAMLKERGLTCSLDIVGTGALEADLKAQAGAMGLAAQVTFHGYVPYGPALFEHYQRAGALVLSSLTEGFPQVINESLCAGLPTVATAVGGIPAFLTNNETALLVPPADAGALARAIEQLARDGDLRERLRRNGRALMAENTLEANRARVMGVLYDEVFANHP
jgi:glycosyltransferase involved in cell wall biosynthesis